MAGGGEGAPVIIARNSDDNYTTKFLQLADIILTKKGYGHVRLRGMDAFDFSSYVREHHIMKG